MIHAKLFSGAENSGKLVARVKNEARHYATENNYKYVLIDGAPGIGCPVISSLAGADFVLIVTEPTIPGFHDLKRVYELVRKFNIPAGCIINKYDLNTDLSKQIENYLASEEIPLISTLPYDESFTRAMIQGQTIIEYNQNSLSEIINQSWNKVKQLIN